MRIIIIATLLLFYNLCIAQKHNKIVPKTVFPFDFKLHQSINNGYFLTSPLKLDLKQTDPHYISTKPTIIDSLGNVFWYMNIDAPNVADFKYHSKDSLFSFIRTKDGIATYLFMDLKFKLIDSIYNINNVKSDAHETLILANGNYIIGGVKDTLMNLSDCKFQGKKGSKKTIVKSYTLQEFNRNHILLFQWDSYAHIHPEQSYDSYGYDSLKYDYAHGNSIEEDSDGNIIVSLRYLNAVYKINHKTGKIIWQLGGKKSSFKFINDVGFSGQHDARVLANGNLSLFDNANCSPEPRSSRAVQYKLDTINWTATKTWEYTQAFFAKGMGNYQVTNNNKHLLNYGLSFRPNPTITVVDNSKKIIAELLFKDSVMSYRAFYFEIPFGVKQKQIFL